MPVADYQPVQEQCERCQATGFEPVDPEEYALSRTPEVSEEEIEKVAEEHVSKIWGDHKGYRIEKADEKRCFKDGFKSALQYLGEKKQGVTEAGITDKSCLKFDHVIVDKPVEFNITEKEFNELDGIIINGKTFVTKEFAEKAMRAFATLLEEKNIKQDGTDQAQP
jgi:hypothetical protein